MTSLRIEEMSDTKNMVDFVIKGKRYCVMKGCLRQALLECKRWQYSGGSNFTIKLFDLIAKADDENKQKILLGFPSEVCAYLMWFYEESFGVKHQSEEEFFEKAVMELRVHDDD